MNGKYMKKINFTFLNRFFTSILPILDFRYSGDERGRFTGCPPPPPRSLSVIREEF